MKCTKCGMELPVGAKFCGSCGARVEQPVTNSGVDEQNQTVQQSVDTQQAYMDGTQKSYTDGTQQAYMDGTQQPYVDGTQQAYANDAKPGPQISEQLRKYLQPKFIAVAAAAVVLIVIVASIISSVIKNHKEAISLEDYITVTSDGYDGYGSVYISFDEDAYYDDMLEKSNVKMEKGDDGDYTLASYFSEEYDQLYTVYSETDYEADNTKGLSNGDVVTITFTYDEEAAKEIGIKYESKSMEYTVSGLESVVEIDPFEDITVEFSGTSPFAIASVVNNSTDVAVSNLSFSLDQSYDIALGDTVTVSISYLDEEDYLENYGYKFTQTSKEYVCENVDHYAASTDDVDDTLLGQMKSQTEDVIDAYFATESDYMTASNITYVGYYFLSYKGTSSYNDQNRIYLVYSATVSSTDGSFGTATVYLPVRYTDIIVYEDGTGYVDLSDYYGIIGDTSLEYGWWSSVAGYDSIALLKNDLITSQKGDYTDSAVGGLE